MKVSNIDTGRFYTNGDSIREVLEIALNPYGVWRLKYQTVSGCPGWAELHGGFTRIGKKSFAQWAKSEVSLDEALASLLQD